MRMLSAAAVVVLLTVPAYAQTPNINLMPEFQSKSPEEKEPDAIKDKAYKDSLRKIPDAKASSDPWGTVRSTDTPKAAAAPAKEEQDRQQQPVSLEPFVPMQLDGAADFDLTRFLTRTGPDPGSSPGHAFAGKRSGKSGE